MSQELIEHLAGKAEFYEEEVDRFSALLDTVLDYTGDYRVLVFRRIALRWATWEHLITALSTLPMPHDRTPGDVLQDILDQLSDEGLICMSAAGASRKYILTERGRQQATNA